MQVVIENNQHGYQLYQDVGKYLFWAGKSRHAKKKNFGVHGIMQMTVIQLHFLLMAGTLYLALGTRWSECGMLTLVRQS